MNPVDIPCASRGSGACLDDNPVPQGLDICPETLCSFVDDAMHILYRQQRWSLVVVANAVANLLFSVGNYMPGFVWQPSAARRDLI